MRSRSLLIATVVLVLVAALLAGTAYSLLSEDTIYPGVRISGVDVGGLTRPEGENRLTDAVSSMDSGSILLRYPGDEVRVSRSDLGATVDISGSVDSAWRVGRGGGVFHRIGQIITAQRQGIDVPLMHGFDTTVSSDFLRGLSRRIDRPAADAHLIVNDGEVSIVPEELGAKLDASASMKRIESALNLGENDIDLVVKTTNPKLTSERLEGIDSVLAHYSTRFKPWERNRTHNLAIACRSINGAIIEPEGVFSYNKIVGPRLAEYGFRNAPIFVNGEVEAGTGGGICQVCTTIYNAALLSNMKIVRRSHHSRPVHYAPVGRDATVAWPSVDFKFKNTTDVPIYIAASLGKSTVEITIFGKKQVGQTVQIVSSGHKVIPVRISTEPPAKPPKEQSKPHAGHKISTYRILKHDGEVVKRELIATDYYRPSTVFVPKPAPSE